MTMGYHDASIIIHLIFISLLRFL